MKREENSNDMNEMFEIKSEKRAENLEECQISFYEEAPNEMTEDK